MKVSWLVNIRRMGLKVETRRFLNAANALEYLLKNGNSGDSITIIKRD